jgi:uncharacterized protein with PIN domain
MGIFSFLLKRPPAKAINVDVGLDYRVIDPFRIEVIIGQKWRDADDESLKRKPGREYLSALRRLNIKATVFNDCEALAAHEVAHNMDHFCEACGEEVLPEDSRCESCRAKLWKGSQPIEFAIVHV